MALVLVNVIDRNGVAAQDSSSERPSTGTHEQARGAGGELRVRQWFAPSDLFLHNKDMSGFYPISAAQVSSLIVEPLF
ncbi:MAG: hypothetical protein AB7V46_14810, partial [Thermomicrobiales bacterium]